MAKPNIIKIFDNYKWIFLLIVVLFFIIIYAVFDPYKVDFFPKCPFLVLTGYKCSGCGSQRAIHNLLNFNLIGAMKENLLLVIFLPYIIVGAILDFTRKKYPKHQKIHDKLFSGKAVWIVFGIILVFWIGRNIIGI
ncbi:MAG: DUF2752 domain-containing protein [Bacteroidales bacterium]|nr:DUF2752 domain-containing protein [Bacteroidales bacterium]